MKSLCAARVSVAQDGCPHSLPSLRRQTASLQTVQLAGQDSARIGETETERAAR
jgi:hypothetical protein